MTIAAFADDYDEPWEPARKGRKPKWIKDLIKDLRKPSTIIALIGLLFAAGLLSPIGSGGADRAQTGGYIDSSYGTADFATPLLKEYF